MAQYVATTRASGHPASSQAATTASTLNATPAPRARPPESSPEAIGRFRLVGCRRSAAASKRSLIKYEPEAAAQKMAKAPDAARNLWPSERTPAAAGATKTRTFLV